MKRTRRRQVLAGLGVASAAGVTGLSGCLGGSSDGDATETGDSSTPLTVGVFAPLSGPFASWGEALVTGARLARADLEAEFGTTVDINEYDTETDPTTGADAMRTAIEEDGIDVAQGGISSAVCAEIGALASENEVTFITQGASNTLTGADCREFVFSVYQSNSMMSTAAGQRMAELGDNWFLVYSDYLWGQNAEGLVAETLEANGSSVVGSTAAPFPADDFSQHLDEVTASDADGIALLVPGLDGRLAASQVHTRGLHEDRAVMVHQLEDMVFWGLDEEVASMVDVGPAGWVNTLEGGNTFKGRVTDEDDDDPFARHYMAYTALDQHVRAAERAGSTDAAAIRDALEGHEITGPVADLQPGSMYWRACDHQLIQPMHVASGRAVGEMQEDPYKQWFAIDETIPGEDVARACEDTGCSL